MSTNDELKVRACRICLDAKHAIRLNFDINSEWSRLIEYCLGLSVTKGTAPRVLCGVCAEKLQEFSKFKKRSLDSAQLWDTVLRSEAVQNEVKSEATDEDSDWPVKKLSDADEYFNIPIKMEKRKQDHRPVPTYINEETIIIGDSIQLSSVVDKPAQILSRNGKKNKTYSYSCTNCGSDFTRKYNYECHLKICQLDKEKATPVHHCGLCEFNTEDLDTLKDHVNGSHGDLLCKICSYSGEDMGDLTHHRFTNHQPVPPKFVCSAPRCNKTKQSALSLMCHYKKEHLKHKALCCMYCDSTYTNYKRFKEHILAKHEDGAKYECDYCGAKFVFRCYIEAHISHAHLKTKSFVCYVCGLTFSKSSNLHSHVKHVHNTSGPVKCAHCNKMFKNEATHEAHMKKVNREKPYICDFCSKSFAKRCDLQFHRVGHLDDRPFECDLCSSKYKRKCHLTIHMRTHTGEKPYVCTICDKRFKCGHSLRCHQSVHTGIRRHKCPFCTRSFHEKKLVLDHCRRKHHTVQMSLSLETQDK